MVTNCKIVVYEKCLKENKNCKIMLLEKLLKKNPWVESKKRLIACPMINWC